MTIAGTNLTDAGRSHGIVHMSVGFTKAGLDRLHRVLSGHVERQFVPGLVALVARADDYLAFSRMLLNKGRHGHEQIYTDFWTSAYAALA